MNDVSPPYKLQDSADFGALIDPAPRRWFLPTVALGLVAAAAACRNVASWDVWWHLAIGRDAARTGGLVPTDTFSYTFNGAPYVHKDIGADWLFYQAFDQFGFPGISLILGLALMIAFAGVRLSLGRHGRPDLWVFLCALLAGAIYSRLIPRPLVFTLAFFPLMLGLIERARRRISARSWQPFFAAMLPAVALQWLWLNLHRGGLIGLVLLLGHALALTLAWGLHKIPRLGRIAGPQPSMQIVGVGFATVIIAIGAGLLTPSGPALYRSGLMVTHDPIHRQMITEWQPLTRELALTLHPVAMLLIGLAALGLLLRLVAALGSRRKDKTPLVDVWHVGVLALFTFQGFASMRWLTYASAAAIAALALLTAEAWNESDARRGEPSPSPGWRSIALAMIAAALIDMVHPSPRGFGPLSQRYPATALEAADRYELGPNVHNAFVYGGYVIWHEDGARRVLIDGRNDMLYPSEFFRRCSRAQHDIALFAELWGETGGDWVLADNTPGRESFRFLSGHPDWMTVYWSEEAVIYVLRSDHPELAEHAFRHISAADPVGSLQLALREAGTDEARLRAVRDELLRMLQASPDSIRANTLLVLYYHHRGPEFWERRNAVLHSMTEAAPDHPAVQALHERLIER